MKAILIITGILTAILGFYAMSVPFMTFLAIGWVLGMMLLINGIENIVLGITQKSKDVWGYLLGGALIILGCILLFNGIQRFLTDVMFAYLVGAGIGVAGVYRLVETFTAKYKDTWKTVLGIILGVLYVITGIFAFCHPFVTMVSVGMIMGISCVLYGVELIMLAFVKKPEQPAA